MNSATTPPKSLMAAFAALELAPKDADWTWLEGGKTNKVWRVDNFVVKLFCPERRNPVFENDPMVEQRVLNALRVTGIAPKLIYSGKVLDANFSVTEFLNGPKWSQNAESVGALLKMVHGLDVADGFPTTLGGHLALKQQAQTLLPQCAPQHQKDLVRLQPVNEVGDTQKRCLIHGDAVPGNIVVTETGPKLVDWQCPAISEPSIDVAIFLSPAMQNLYRGKPLTPNEEAAFWSGYSDADVKNRTEELKPWFHWRMAVYCAWKVATGFPEYGEGYALELDALRAQKN